MKHTIVPILIWFFTSAVILAYIFSAMFVIDAVNTYLCGVLVLTTVSLLQIVKYIFISGLMGLFVTYYITHLSGEEI